MTNEYRGYRWFDKEVTGSIASLHNHELVAVTFPGIPAYVQVAKRELVPPPFKVGDKVAQIDRNNGGIGTVVHLQRHDGKEFATVTFSQGGIAVININKLKKDS